MTSRKYDKSLTLSTLEEGREKRLLKRRIEVGLSSFITIEPIIFMN